ncbi:hypothetical protein F2Q70_00009569 [Brassica cretica]|uniref:Uncharacterized protein n=1 Tax=Brassica cretica TaxID=69181 RepID=A0A8S9MG40_BRACR|nr:hypothetical protein F2Q70_00009569 [Brassica cretica]
MFEILRAYEAVEGSGDSVSIHSLRLPLLSFFLSPSKAITRALKQRHEPHGFTVQSKAQPRHRFSSRFVRINDYTNKFCGAYAAAERHIRSGQSETDVLKAAYDIYFANHTRKFNLEHAWCLLRFEQKWLRLNTPKPSGSGDVRSFQGS